MGTKEIEKGRGIADERMVREGCEKVFHAFVEAAAARIQKYGLGIPESHDDIRQGLYIAGPRDLLDTGTRCSHACMQFHTIADGWIILR
jgi:hypothetical protein